MKKTMSWLACLGLVFFLGCSGGEVPEAGDADHGDASGEAQAIATIEPKNDSGVTGTATFQLAGEQVMLTLTIANATPGEHAFHLHEVGDCSSEDGKSAGGHWNPTEQEHGQWGGDAFHLGDVANLEVGEDGSATLTVATNLWTIGTGGDNDVVGRAVIVHAGVDDFSTQPTGAAGGRIGCGVIQLAP
jgi:Cu-Zn family superoxide dismutase